MEAERSAISSTSRDAAPPKAKFMAYQNPAFSAALTVHSLRPSGSTLLILSVSLVASASALLGVASREDDLVKRFTEFPLSHSTSHFLAKFVQAVTGLVFLGCLSGFIRAWSLKKAENALANGVQTSVSAVSSSKNSKEQPNALTKHQLNLLGMSLSAGGLVNAEASKKPPKSKPVPSSELLVPIRKSSFSSTPARPVRLGYSQQKLSGGKIAAQSPSSHSGPLGNHVVTPPTAWSRQSPGSAKGIQTEEMLDQYLAGVEDKDAESDAKVTTPPPSIRGFVISSPSSVTTTQTTPSGATRSTPLRPARMSPGSHQKYVTPPKKGEGELPRPMTMEEAVSAFESLGVYPQIEQWRDRLRQWFSSALINPLLEKIETSHIQVMQAAAALGTSITVSQVGGDPPSTIFPVNLSPGGAKDWLPTVTLDEDGLLHQLRASLLQARDGSISPLGGMQRLQPNPLLPAIQACIDAITEHQRLNTLMKGEIIKGILPQSSLRADYAAKRVRELAEGTCLKNYDYMGSGGGYDKGSKMWKSELPTDSHLLLYLFCAFLEHPKWMLHVDPTSYSSAQSSKSPLFLGVLPPKERFPEKYVAVISGVPAVIHPGAFIIAVGKQSPPIFSLYWDKKLQFSLQGRTALWDTVLLLCHRIRTAYGGVVRGVHLGSSAFNILQVLESDSDN